MKMKNFQYVCICKPPGWGFGVGLTTPHSKKLIVMKVEQRKKLDGFGDDGESW
jgi:hypothetical protein